ncbi:MAG: glycine cleavage system aminomethyltransferase GcvT [Alicyclobacillus sp.]|nr:glycine cleavage system aminomethyltransferase GcvT [Alicyclobacillus sp.]
MKKTPLHALYAEFGARTVEFNGWEMPVQFTSILAEHEAVRTRAGMFDISHMGEFEISGPDSRRFLQYMLTNDVSKLAPGAALYSPLVRPDGGCVDDLLAYCFSDARIWVVVNAGNIEKDLAWLQQHRSGFDVTIRDCSDEVALLALQGPNSAAILQRLTSVSLSNIAYYHFVEGAVADTRCLVSRTGYTGEDGFELYCAATDAARLWRALWDAGQPYGLLACGLGCRDTLRLEAGLPLYGHELTEQITPLEAGLGPFVKLEKGAFMGREALSAQRAEGVRRKLAGIVVRDRGIPRAGYGVFQGDVEVGFVTSGTMSPTLKVPIGLVLIDAAAANVGKTLTVDTRGRRVAAEVVKTPFYRRSKR